MKVIEFNVHVMQINKARGGKKPVNVLTVVCYPKTAYSVFRPVSEGGVDFQPGNGIVMERCTQPAP